MKCMRYDDSGRILFKCEMPEAHIPLQLGNMFIGDADPDESYIVNGAVVPRPVSPVIVDAANTLRNIPDAAVVTINGKDYPATASTCQLEFTYPGVYRVSVRSFPYLDFILEVTQ